MISFGILILSDKGARGERQDLCAAEIRTLLNDLDTEEKAYEVIPDDDEEIVAKLVDFCDVQKLDLVLTSGGTGVAPRDRTPQSTERVVDYTIPGISEAMRMESLKITPHAMISRGIAGVRGKTLIINLPGSPKAVKENLAVIIPALKHTIEKIKGDPSECGSG